MTSTSVKIVDNDFYRFSIAVSVALLVGSAFLGLYVHPLCALLGLAIPIVLSIQSGVELNLDAMQYRKFRSVLGQRSGTWKNYTSQHVLVLLSKSGSKGVVNPRMLLERTITDTFLELYLMDALHVKRLFLCASRNPKKIKRLVDRLTAHSALALQAYSPATARQR